MTLPSFITDMPNWGGVYGYTPPIVREILSEHQTRKKANDMSPAVDWKDSWISWINHDGDLNFNGCQKKKQWAPCNGIHDGLIQQLAYASRKHSCIAMFADDYLFYQVIADPYKKIVLNWDRLDLLPTNSYVLVSWPNHRGLMDDSLERLLSACRATNSRIFLDCAFFGTIMDGICNTGDDIFDAVAFSISKPFLCGGLRAGIIWGDDLAPTLTIPCSIHYSYNYYNINSVECGTKILSATTPRTIPMIFKDEQIKWCTNHGFTPGDVVFYALGNNPSYREYRKNGSPNLKVCITDHVVKSLA
jgi:hypothetical protein